MMKIIEQELDIEFETGAIGLYLSQTSNIVDGRTLELKGLFRVLSG